MADAMVTLGRVSLTSAQNAVVFSNIPSIYRGLRLVVNGSTSGVGSLVMQFNSDASASYNLVGMRGNSSGGTSAGRSHYENGNTFFDLGWSQNNTGSPLFATVDMLNYSVIDRHKSLLSRNNYTDDAGNSVVETSAGRWANNSAVNSIKIYLGASTFAAGSTFTLYGIAA